MPPSRHGGVDTFLRDEAGNRPCPPAAKADTLRRMNSQGLITGAQVLTLAGHWLCAVVPCTARFVGPNYKKQGGLAPDVVGGEQCLAAVSFLSLSGGPGGRWGWRHPVPGRCTGLGPHRPG